MGASTIEVVFLPSSDYCSGQRESLQQSFCGLVIHDLLGAVSMEGMIQSPDDGDTNVT